VGGAAAFPGLSAAPQRTGTHAGARDGNAEGRATSAPKSAELFTEPGSTPVKVNAGGSETLESCVTCLSVRLRDLHA
jgi:dimethylargininase